MAVHWSDIEAVFVEDAEAHQRACEALGLQSPADVFVQLFHEHHADEAFAEDLATVDWAAVVWEEGALSGVKCRQVAVPRGYQYAVDEARALTQTLGLTDQREAVQASWRESGTWVQSPVLLEGAVLGSLVEYELRVGFTRFGDLLGLLDRGEVKEWATHRVWVGRRS